MSTFKSVCSSCCKVAAQRVVRPQADVNPSWAESQSSVGERGEPWEGDRTLAR